MLPFRELYIEEIRAYEIRFITHSAPMYSEK